MPNLETPEDSAPSLWHRAVHEDGKTRSEALNQLAASYWYCVYAWWRRAGLDVSGTTTATLATFTRWIIETPPCADDSGVARMREWIPARLSELGQQGVKLTGEASISIDPAWAERRYADEPAGEPDGIFHRRWALTVLEFTAATMQAEYAARDEQGLYAELLTFAGFDSNEDEHIAAVAGRLERSVSAIGMAVVNFRSRQREVLQSFVAGTVLDPADANSEITALLCACDAPGPDTAAAPLPSAIRGLRPDEMLARAMASVRKTGVSTGGWQSPTLEEAKRLFPQYEVISLHGRGAMGAVYRARQIELDRSVAIKLLPLEVSTDQDFADRFRREARALAKLNHPNIIMVHDFGTTSEGHLFFVMEFVDGADLHQMIHGPGLSPPQALEIISGICDALAYAHAKGVVHRDIKPANVMVGVDGQVKVADFGLARLLDPGADHPGHTMTGTIMGTPDYMAPEQMRGMNVDHRADIYSLGVMLYEMLCKEVPRGIFDPPSIRIPGVNTRIDRVVTTAMQQQPDRRYQTTVEMKTDVALARESPAAAPKSAVPPKPLAPPQQAPPQPEPKPSPKAKPRKSRQPRAGGGKPGKLVYAGIGIAIAVVTVVGVILNSGGPEPDSENTGVPPAAATKDAPFVNFLGMKFVPVPISGGPTKDQRVLFSVWHTRVQDYSQFVKEAKLEWPKAEFEQAPDHPAVTVSWEDAKAFCEWMTLRERAAGKIAEDQHYRLPSDHEWSCAAGIGDLEEAEKLPVEKSDKVAGFSWGTAWPPPKGAGNFSGEEMKSLFASGTVNYGHTDVMPGYNDGFVHTSPVGNFAMNRFGLCDMSGNVLQWCEDWYDKSLQRRVLRGGSWNAHNAERVRVSLRINYTPGTRNRYAGFRCVLAPSAPTPVKPGNAATTPTASGRLVNLLSLVDVKRDAIKGVWIIKPEGLALAQPPDFGVLELPYEPPAEYDYEAEFTPTGNGNNPNLYLNAGGSSFAWKVNAHGKTPPIYGLDLLDGKLMPARTEAVATNPLRIETGQRYTTRVEVRRDGLRGFVNGKEMLHWTGDFKRLSMEAGSKLRNERALGVGSYKRAVVFHRIEVREVNGAGRLTATASPAANNTPATVSKAAPFVNTLGMKFVPVPITGGPTDGKNVLFSIWETRRSDYQGFVAATKRPWPKPNWELDGFVETPDHPAVTVSRNDATEFCAWLTKTERESGKIAKDAVYRLPKDHEWSCAVGIGDKEDPAASPTEKSGKIKGYLWGTVWPPPQGVENYYGEEATSVPYGNVAPIAGYRDPFPRTAPVGSFKPNALGLYDLGGNVLEWCEEEWREPGKPDGKGILRGESWWRKYVNDQYGLSSTRTPHPKTARFGFDGFRVVLETSVPD